MQSALAKAFYLEYNGDNNKDKEALDHYESVIKRAICEFPN